MKIYALYLYKVEGEKSIVVDSAKDFTDVGFLYRKNCVEISDFFSAQLASSKNPQANVTAEEQQFLFQCSRMDNYCAILVSTKDYPTRPAFSILREIFKEVKNCGGVLPNGKSSVIQRGIVEYQDPTKADKLAQIQQNLDQTREIMVMSLEKAIARGESLEELAEKSQNISDQSKIFVRESKKLNRCCTVI